MPWPPKYITSTKSTMRSSARRRPLQPQLQQKNTSFSVGMEPQWQPKKATFSIGSNRDKRTSNGIHDASKEFGLMIREKLQEFAMILIKKYHYNFPVKDFDDYRGSFNKEEFIGVEWKKDTGFGGIDKEGGC